MVLFLIVCVIFLLLIKIFVSEKHENFEPNRKEIVEIKFNLPREVIADIQPEAIPIWEREKRRRKLLNEVFLIGVSSRARLEQKQVEDRALSNRSYYYYSHDKSKIICNPDKTKQEIK
ncbi:MAG: hypothetical protein WC526_02305 [Patescibacteria group bacterium]